MFRIKFTDHDGTWWTERIDNWAVVCLFIHLHRRQGIGSDAFPDSRRLSKEIAGYLDNAPREQARTGQRQVSSMSASPRGPSMQPITVYAVRVPDYDPERRPEADCGCVVAVPADAKPQDEPRDELPRDLAGPLPEEVAAHTVVKPHTPAPSPQPQVAALDHGGGRRQRREEEKPLQQLQPLLQPPDSSLQPESFWDRLLKLVTGAERGREVAH